MRHATADKLFRIGAAGTAASAVLGVTPLLHWLVGPTPRWLEIVLVLALLGSMAICAVGWDIKKRVE